MTLGEKLREARKQAELSQEQLAEKLNISRSAIAKWETDLGIPDIENLRALSRMLSLSIEDLLDDEQSLEEAIQGKAESIPDTYCGKTCNGCTYQERLDCSGCKEYPHHNSGGCAIARCCQDRKISHCGQCNYLQRCNKFHTRIQAPAQRISAQIRQEEIKARNEVILERAQMNLTLLAKHMPLLLLAVKATIACSVCELLLGRFVSSLDLWIAIPVFITQCLYAVTLLRMTPIHPHYRPAGLFSIVHALLSCIAAFLSQSSALYFLILLAGSVLQLMGERFEYHSHADVLQDVDSELSEKWRSLWNREMLCICVVLMSTLLSFITLLPLFTVILLIATLALVVVSCLKWVYISRSASIFRDYPVNALLNRVKFRLNNMQ